MFLITFRITFCCCSLFRGVVLHFSSLIFLLTMKSLHLKCKLLLKTLVWNCLQFYKVERKSLNRNFLKICFKVKVKVTPWNFYASAKWGRKYISKRFATSTLEESGWSEPRAGRFTPGKYLTPIAKVAGCASESVRTGSENLACTRIRSPIRPARRKSLFRPPVFKTVSFLKQWFISSQVFF